MSVEAFSVTESSRRGWRQAHVAEVRNPVPAQSVHMPMHTTDVFVSRKHGAGRSRGASLHIHDIVVEVQTRSLTHLWLHTWQCLQARRISQLRTACQGCGVLRYQSSSVSRRLHCFGHSVCAPHAVNRTKVVRLATAAGRIL